MAQCIAMLHTLVNIVKLMPVLTVMIDTYCTHSNAVNSGVHLTFWNQNYNPAVGFGMPEQWMRAG